MISLESKFEELIKIFCCIEYSQDQMHYANARITTKSAF